MPTASAKPTTAANLEAKFDAGDDVLDFFDVDSAKVVWPVGKAAPKSRRSSIDELKRAIKITKEIEKLERELSSIFGKQAGKPRKHAKAMAG